ncbi:LysM peptidoglycan-binding domain-containing protein [Flavobacterium sp.]|uniref:C40 family peptidase n=1 Tax=Flavobacterium sp. TaxID=239 RepID=UPI00286BDB42|nr:LysM peptidoglycan-binding domain-containing protein [Flavobacterium sp.]
MKFFKFIFLIIIFCSTTAFSQKIIKHNVKSGESIYSIAQKYDVTEKDIYELNPKLKGAVLGIKVVVTIPNKKFKGEEEKSKVEKKKIASEIKKKEENSTTTNSSFITHIIKPKETLYSLSKQYGVTMEEICEMNPELKTGNLKIGAKLKFNHSNFISDIKGEVKIEHKLGVEEPKLTEIISENAVMHKVQPKETLFRISKKYGVSVSELQKLNPNLPSGLPVGYNLIVKAGIDENVIVAPIEIISNLKEVKVVKPISFENVSKADFLIAKASENLGVRYRSGGTTNDGFDCSGLMFSTFKNIDMILPRTSKEMANYGQQIDKSQAQKGDLIFFATFGKGRISHVGMVTEVVEEEIKFIHSSTQMGVIISSTKEDYYARSFIQINRILTE